MNQLLEIFDRVDVVVWWWRYQSDARRRMPGTGDPRVHLEAGQLAALPRLGALGHLDLQVVGVDQVVAGHTESPGGDLLDTRRAQITVRVRDVSRCVLAALA